MLSRQNLSADRDRTSKGGIHKRLSVPCKSMDRENSASLPKMITENPPISVIGHSSLCFVIWNFVSGSPQVRALHQCDESLFGQCDQLVHLLKPLSFELDLAEALGGPAGANAHGNRIGHGQSLLKPIGKLLSGRGMES